MLLKLGVLFVRIGGVLELLGLLEWGGGAVRTGAVRTGGVLERLGLLE